MSCVIYDLCHILSLDETDLDDDTVVGVYEVLLHVELQHGGGDVHGVGQTLGVTHHVPHILLIGPM